ncbi:MAG: helix-turn-helix transcriptional regulator [Clostridium sp.]|uniref:helix-turn-helix transcriptional regulator n=1 Tax=Clostridium sp. TaxID=1506 RepID=UPI003F415C3F
MKNNIKFFKFISILRENSSRENGLSIEDINKFMFAEVGEMLNRKTIYAYIKDARELGIEISEFNRSSGYYIQNPMIKKKEIKVISDCLHSNKCIPYELIEEIEKKLLKCNSVYTRYSIKKQNELYKEARSKNKQIIDNIDVIYEAIEEGKKISFNYGSIDEKRDLICKSEEGKLKRYIANPIYLGIKNDYYYLLLNKESHTDLSWYRLDRILNVQILEEDIKEKGLIEGIDREFTPNKYMMKCFKMYAGKDKDKINVEIITCKDWVKNYIIEELGDLVKVNKSNDEYILIFEAFNNNGLINWLLGLGADIKVIGPDVLVESIRATINEMNLIYKLKVST